MPGSASSAPCPRPIPSASRRSARRPQALGRPWPEAVSYGEYLRGLDRSDPACLAIMRAAGGLFRGAGYEAFDGTVPRDPVQSAIAAPYAHVTAPLRRLVDRWGLVVCEAVSAGREVPGWARQSLAALPSLMGISSQRASQLESASVARVEAAVLADRVGERFDATVLELRDDRAVIQLADPAVTATCPAGDRTRPASGSAWCSRAPISRRAPCSSRSRAEPCALGARRGSAATVARRVGASDVPVDVLLVFERELVEVVLGRRRGVVGALVGAFVGALVAPRLPRRCPRAACPSRRGTRPCRGTRTRIRLRSSRSPLAHGCRWGIRCRPPYSRRPATTTGSGPAANRPGRRRPSRRRCGSPRRSGSRRSRTRARS